jgi:hypothetical protein
MPWVAFTFILVCAFVSAEEVEALALKTLGMKDPLEVNTAMMFSDGGTVGLEIRGIGEKDVGISFAGPDAPPKRVFQGHWIHGEIWIGATHPITKGARPCNADEKQAVVLVLRKWVDRVATPEQQKELIDPAKAKGESAMKIHFVLWALRMAEPKAAK